MLQRLALPLVFALCAITASGQDILNITLDGTEQGKTLPDLFQQLERKYPVRFYYLDSWFANTVIQKTIAANVCNKLWPIFSRVPR